jgi:hypothetical protein
MPVKDQKVTHDGEKITISRPCFKRLAFATYTAELYNQISSVTWSVARSETGKEYLKSTKYGQMHQLIIEHFYGKEVLKEAYANNYVIDHLDNNGYENIYENLALIPRKENSAKGLTYDIERKEAMRKFVVNITKDMGTGEFQVSVIFNIPFNLISRVDNTIVPLHVLYFRYGTDYKTAFIDARGILNDLDANGSIDFGNLRYKTYDFRKTEVVYAEPEEIKNGMFFKDSQVYFIQGSPHTMCVKVPHNKELHVDK